MTSEPRIAFVLDSLPSIGGGEKTLFAALESFPHADVFTLIYNRPAFEHTPLARRKIFTSYLDYLPFSHAHHRLLLPLMPSAIEQFDLYKYDVVIAFSYAVAHGLRNLGEARHLCYMYTPMRYAWSDINIDGSRSRKNPGLEILMNGFRAWDRNAAARVHEFAAVSQGIAARIRTAYQREARVIYPPVDIERFSPNQRRNEYFVNVSRLVPHKRLDVVVEAFSHLKLPLKIIGEGAERKRLERRAGRSIEFLGYQPDEAVAGILSSARGFVCAAEEDFGIAIVEAQAAGCPVIAYKGGGALETVSEGETGLFFQEQRAASLIEALQRFDDSVDCFRPDMLRDNARRFSKGRFLQEFGSFVGNAA